MDKIKNKNNNEELYLNSAHITVYYQALSLVTIQQRKFYVNGKTMKRVGMNLIYNHGASVIDYMGYAIPYATFGEFMTHS